MRSGFNAFLILFHLVILSKLFFSSFGRYSLGTIPLT